MMKQSYRCVATSRLGFIQQVVVSYVCNCYFFYVLGKIPEAKDPERVDKKLIEQYGLDISKWTRARRKRAGVASVQYLRYDHTFVLIATEGEHAFFLDERPVIQDLRRVPLTLWGYSIGYRNARVHVQIDRETLRSLRASLMERALDGNDPMRSMLRRLPFEPYAPVRRQLLKLLRAVNRRRVQAGILPLPLDVLRMRRRIAQPFGGAQTEASWQFGEVARA